MELITESDIYTPSIDDIGNYIDNVPSFNTLLNGLRCPCGSRKNKIYTTYAIFTAHIKSKSHQKWLDYLNLNKTNYYIENERMKVTIKNQQLIIAKFEKDLNNKSMTIDYLTQQLLSKQTTNTGGSSSSDTTDNLLDF